MKHTDKFYNVRFNTKEGGEERQFLTHVETENSAQAITEVQRWLETYWPSGHFYVVDCSMRQFPYLQEEDDEFLDSPEPPLPTFTVYYRASDGQIDHDILTARTAEEAGSSYRAKQTEVIDVRRTG